MFPTPGPLSRDARLRTELVALLRGGHAHVTVADALASVPPGRAGERPTGHAHSLWELLVHLRLAQADILAFTRARGDAARYTEPAWPAGYWPASAAGPGDWEREHAAFLADLDALVALVHDPFTDLFAEFAGAPGYTALREALLAADHTAHHLGQVVSLRRALGLWPPDESAGGS